MKFTYKLFFSITALLTAAFMLFGSFMLFSYFNRMLERETEQGKRENLLFQTIYDMVYQNMEKYGAEFAGIQAGNSATERMTDQNGMECMILETDGTITLEGSLKLPQDEIRTLAEEMIRTMDPGADQVYGVRKVGTCYYLLSIITDQATDSADTVYLGILKDLSGIYEERSSMMRQYGIALAGLLVIGGLAAFLLSRYLTSPIEQLNRTAGRIAGGDFEKRAVYQGTDEIGELSRSFNRMTDRLMHQMEEKELEAKQKEDFTAAFAHELKTPLTSIIGYADMLNSYELTEQERGEATYYIFSQGNRYSDYVDLFDSDRNGKYVPTGTCRPFERKLFLTVNGKILPCERIGQECAIARLSDGKLNLDCSAVAKYYSSLYKKIIKSCVHCNLKKSCGQCLFLLKEKNGQLICPGIETDAKLREKFSAFLTYAESNPGDYERLLSSIIVA